MAQKNKKLLEETRQLELMVEAQQLEAQLAQKNRAQLEAAPPMDLGSQAAQALRSGVEGLTFGLSEPVMSGIMAAQQNLKHSAQQAEGVGDFASKAVDLDRLKAEYEADVARRRRFEAEHPTLAMTSEMTGALVPMAFTGGASAPLSAAGEAGALAKVGRLANLPNAALVEGGEAVGALARQIPGAGALLESKGVLGSAARVAESGAKGAAQAVAMEGSKRAIQEPTGFIRPEDNLPSLGETALMGGAFTGGLTGVAEAAGQAVRGAKLAGRVLGGVSEENISRYLENPEAIRGAKSIEEVKMAVDDTMAKLRDDVDTSKLNKEQAVGAMKEAQSKLDDLVKQNKFLVASEKAEVRQQLRAAKQNLDFAMKEATSEIKTARMPLQADDVLDSVEKVKQQVSELSTESYKILELHKGKFNLGGVTSQVKKLQNELKVGGQLLSADSESAHGVLGKWAEKLQAIEAGSKGGLPGGQVKKIIQELDSDIRSASDRLAGEFSDKTHKALMGVRRVLDEKLKTQVAGYAEVMGETAKLNQLRADFSKMFGKRESVTSKMARIENPNLQFERDRLVELGTLTGKDFKTPLEEYMALKNRGRTTIAQEELRRGLPEHGDYVDAVTQNARLSRPEYLEGIVERARTASPEAAALREAQGVASGATEQLAAAQGALDPFKRITPANSENVIRTLMGDRSRKIELKKLMGQLGQVADEDFVAMINDLRTKEAFEKGYQNGSANTNVWAGIFGLIGGLTGFDPSMGLMSAGAGASVGRFMDAYGPATTRRVLDAIVFMRGIPTVQKLSNALADLPPQLVQEMKAELVRMVTIGNTSNSVVVPAEQRAEVAMDLDGSDSLTSVEKAKAITNMNKNGAVDSQVMQKLVIGGEKPDPASELNRAEPHRKLPPTYQQVTDFVKNRKPEGY